MQTMTKMHSAGHLHMVINLHTNCLLIPLNHSLFFVLTNAISFADDSDDEEDILKIKRKNVQIEDHDSDDQLEEINVPLSSSKNKKALTKAAVAKKFLRKKILPNKKMTFDDEGEVSFILVILIRCKN